MNDPDPDPSEPSAAYRRMAERYHLPRSLMGGNAAMRAAGETYLPRHPAENRRHYEARLKRTVLRNFFARTIDSLIGKVFAKPLCLGDDMPAALRAYAANVDLAGHGLDAFARTLFRDALIDGIAYVLVDFPAVSAALNLAQERALGARPYAVGLSAAEVIGARAEMIGGHQVLTQVRIRRALTEPADAFGEQSVEEILVLEPDLWRRYRLVEGAWSLAADGRNSLGAVPVVALQTAPVGFFEARPPLEALAWMQLEHWQLRSDQRNALNVASFPILAASGWREEDDGEIEFGPNKLLTMSSDNGKFYYVESSGAHLAAGRDEIEALERQMRQFGLQFETRAGSKETATGRAIDAGEGMAPLLAWAGALKVALEDMFGLFARWQGLDPATVGTIIVDCQPDWIGDRKHVADILTSARANGEISRAAYLGELKRLGVLSDDFDVALDAVRRAEPDAGLPAEPAQEANPAGRHSLKETN